MSVCETIYLDAQGFVKWAYDIVSYRSHAPESKQNRIVADLISANIVALSNEYVAKMAAVQYEKCASIHTQRFDRFEYTIRVLSVHFFSPRL